MFKINSYTAPCGPHVTSSDCCVPCARDIIFISFEFISTTLNKSVKKN